MSRLGRAALVAFCLHLLAGAAMAIILRQGLETNPNLEARLSFLADHRALWTIGWLSWTAAAISIFYFYWVFAATHGSPHFAVLLTAAALAPDLGAQAIEIGLLPDLVTHADLFLILHRTAVLMTGYLANGLYSLSALILAWSTRRAYPSWISFAGVATGFFGLMLSVAALMDSPAGMLWINAVLVPTILLWLAGVARHSNPVRK